MVWYDDTDQITEWESI